MNGGGTATDRASELGAVAHDGWSIYADDEDGNMHLVLAMCDGQDGQRDEIQ